MSDSTEVYFAGTNTFYNFTKQPNTTYYWQVRAMFNEIVVLSIGVLFGVLPRGKVWTHLH
jgi:hypothetical protein